MVYGKEVWTLPKQAMNKIISFEKSPPKDNWTYPFTRVWIKRFKWDGHVIMDGRLFQPKEEFRR
jgi:hypothetical protein